MQVPLEIQFHNMERSDALEAAARKHAEKLERFADDIVSCRVTIEAPHKSRRHGKVYQVTVDVRAPGGEIVASREPGLDPAHEDPYVALRDAFKAARRRLQDYVRVRRGKVKTREGPPHGRITSIHADRQHGHIVTPDGREIYFHRNSVVNADFDKLEPGMEVRFAEEEGDEGPQASSVHVVGKTGD
ncbi:MAG TPA: HPF/RaiA family ribosome-associated protein [Gammaproteobacteria bacterium]